MHKIFHTILQIALVHFVKPNEMGYQINYSLGIGTQGIHTRKVEEARNIQTVYISSLKVTCK